MEIRIGRLDFEWNEDKAATNIEKHGVAFEDAVPQFPLARGSPIAARRLSGPAKGFGRGGNER